MKKKPVTKTQKALNLWAIILIVWAVYRTYFKLPIWFDEFIAKPIVFILPVFFYIKKAEKTDFFKGLDIRRDTKLLVREIVIGLAIGLALFTVVVVSTLIKTGSLDFLTKMPAGWQLIVVILTAFATGISEEILSRGFVLKRLFEESKRMYSAAFFSSILFFFLHVPILFTNAKITGNLLLFFMATDLVLSMITGLIFLQRKSLTLPVLIHAFYNIVVGIVIT